MAEITDRLPVMEIISAAWQKVKGAKLTFFVVLCICIAAVFCLQLIAGLIMAILDNQGGRVLGTITIAIAVIVQIIMSWGMIYIGIQRAADKPIRVSMIKYVFDVGLFFKMIGLYLLQMLICLPTIILPIIAAIITHMSDSTMAHLASLILNIAWDVVFLYLMLRMFLSKAIVIAEKVDPLTAIKRSVKATEGLVWHVFGFTLVILFLLGISLIPLGIGLIWSLPLLLIAYGMLYQRLGVGSRNS